MPYLVYNGKLVMTDSKFVMGELPEIISLADFDNTDVTLSESVQPSIIGDMKLNFKMYLDSNTGFNNKVFNLAGSSTDWFAMSMKDSSIYISVASNYPLYYTSYTITPGLSQIILDCEIRKNPYAPGAAKNYPIYFKVNDVSIAGTSTFPGSSAKAGSFAIGGGIMYLDSLTFNNKMGGGTIWDISITEVSTGNVLNFWKGYGNTLEDWTDFEGSLDATAIDAMGTRTVPGFVPS
jgi:hypothetical protein